MGHTGYITVTVSEDVDVDIDDIMDEVPTEELIKELKKRNIPNTDYHSNNGLSLDTSRKLEIIEQYINNFSYEEICNFFERGENGNAKIIQDLTDLIEELEDNINDLEFEIDDLKNSTE